MNKELIAPCGMNCALCANYLAKIRFLIGQAETWRCPRCGGTVSCHNGLCFSCDFETLKGKKSKYRWTE
jgi:hypothetical protein